MGRKFLIFYALFVAAVLLVSCQIENKENLPSLSQANTSEIRPNVRDCSSYYWPPDCSIIPDPPYQKLCEICSKNNSFNQPSSRPDNKIYIPDTKNIGKLDGREPLPSCGNNYLFFNTTPLKLNDFSYIIPLGNTNPSGHTFPTDHIYFMLNKPSDDSAPYLVPLYAAGDTQITSITASEHKSENPPYTDYGVDFSSCKEFVGRYGHMTELSQKLLAALTPPYDELNEYTTGGKVYKTYRKQVMIFVSAGEELGAAGGIIGQNTLDFNAYDQRSTLTFINSERWEKSNYLHAVCPIDYFESTMKTRLTGKLGDSRSPRIIEPICGEIDYDVRGTAQGVWFAKNFETYPEDPHLALVKDNFNPKWQVFSVGNSISSLLSGKYYFEPLISGLINRNFAEVSDENIYCYEVKESIEGSNKPFIILIQLSNQTNLKIEKQSKSNCGNGLWEFSGYSEFER